jgi:hypothetical protein
MFGAGASLEASPTQTDENPVSFEFRQHRWGDAFGPTQESDHLPTPTQMHSACQSGCEPVGSNAPDRLKDQTGSPRNAGEVLAPAGVASGRESGC